MIHDGQITLESLINYDTRTCKYKFGSEKPLVYLNNDKNPVRFEAFFTCDYCSITSNEELTWYMITDDNMKQIICINCNNNNNMFWKKCII